MGFFALPKAHHDLASVASLSTETSSTTETASTHAAATVLVPPQERLLPIGNVSPMPNTGIF